MTIKQKINNIYRVVDKGVTKCISGEKVGLGVCTIFGTEANIFLKLIEGAISK